MTFLMVCTGTAGHINPGLCIADEIKDRLPEAKIIFVGADRPLEQRLIPAARYELVNIKMSGIKRGIKPSDIIHNIKTVINVLSAKTKVKKLLKNTKPNAVIGTGGYICYPVLKTAAAMKVPTFIHESNAKPGMTVKMLSGIVDKVMIAFEGYDEYYKKPDRLVLTGTPLRREFYSPDEDNLQTQQDNKQEIKPLIVSFWGSLGAERMNDIMAGFVKSNLMKNSFYHTHGAGNSFNILIDKLAQYGITKTEPPYADIREYIEDMPVVMKKADLVLCRAGAISIAELLALGKPSILVPSQYVPDNVQGENAKQLEKLGAAVVLDEESSTAEILFEKAIELISDKEKLNKMALAAKKLKAPNATSDIVDLILKDTGAQ